ncbi:MAG: hypothetical protein ACYTGC_07885 [Planctomycetota bacterium]|jgi:hypothetical protein
MRRVTAVAMGIAVVGGLSGCARSSIKFTNVSDSWLNVSYYTGSCEPSETAPGHLHRRKALQVEPGDSTHYRPTRKLVHIQVEQVGPTWVPTGKQYWLELLTKPPLHIVASGHGEKLEFKSFRGEVAIIPEGQRTDGRFAYRDDGLRAPAGREAETPAAVAETAVAPK